MLLKRLMMQPVHDYLAALRVTLGEKLWPHVLVVAASFVAGWWIYVPFHELAHAFGCIATGGEVTRLEIDWIYGAPLLASIFPFVTVGSDYAGQLTGFDTHGNDLIYLATDFCPFLLTVLFGVPLLRWVALGKSTILWRCVALGAALPVAYAPFVSLPGDYYEMGSIIVSRAVGSWSPEFDLGRWRSDDLFTALAFATYWAGTLVSDSDLLFARSFPSPE
jgi:hypothetical protein